MYRLGILILILGLGHCIQLAFYRNVQCIQVGPKSCLKWQQTTVVFDLNEYFCFPAATYVHTKNGPKKMSQLRIGDEILGLNPKTGKVGYSPILAWLHFDPLATAQFLDIETTNGTFKTSPYHNIAFFNKQDKIGYKFAKSFQRGDRLVQFPDKPLEVLNITSHIKYKGLFSPYTDFKNYFVYQNGFNPTSANVKNSKMILSHVLAQVQNPQSKDTLTSVMMWGSSILGNGYQPVRDEIYTHPSIRHLNFFYGSSWKNVHNRVSYESNEIIQAGTTNTKIIQHLRKTSLMHGLTLILNTVIE